MICFFEITSIMAHAKTHLNHLFKTKMVHFATPSKGLFTWSGGPRSSGVGFFCFQVLGDTKQKKPTRLDRGPPLHVNRP